MRRMPTALAAAHRRRRRRRSAVVAAAAGGRLFPLPLNAAPSPLCPYNLLRSASARCLFLQKSFFAAATMMRTRHATARNEACLRVVRAPLHLLSRPRAHENLEHRAEQTFALARALLLALAAGSPPPPPLLLLLRALGKRRMSWRAGSGGGDNDNEINVASRLVAVAVAATFASTATAAAVRRPPPPQRAPPQNASRIPEEANRVAAASERPICEQPWKRRFVGCVRGRCGEDERCCRLATPANAPNERSERRRWRR